MTMTIRDRAWRSSLLLACILLSTPLHTQASNPPPNTAVPTKTAANPSPHKPTKSITKRFAVTGPILTVTLKEPVTENTKRSPITPQPQPTPQEPPDSPPPTTTTRKHILARLLLLKPSLSSAPTIPGLSSLSPAVLWAVRSTSPPLPLYLPQLRSTSLTAGYRYDDLRNRPSFFEGSLNLGLVGGRVEVDVNPTFEVRKGQAAAVVRVGGGGGGGGSWFGLARFANRQGGKILQYVRGSYKFNMPFATVGSLAITPTYDLIRNEASCHLVGKSASDRTAAILNLNFDKPTLSVMHALDERNTIRPEISLNDAKITYSWDVALSSGGSIQTRVDPVTAIRVTWIDRTEGGKWVTDFNLPLTGGPGPLAGDIRVRRQFAF